MVNITLIIKSKKTDTDDFVFWDSHSFFSYLLEGNSVAASLASLRAAYNDFV